MKESLRRIVQEHPEHDLSVLLQITQKTRNSFGYVERNQYITPQKLFNYYIQAFETEYNITLLSRIFEFLKDKKTKMVLYVYDSMLFDFSLEDGKETLQSLKELISSDFPIKLKKGNTYSSLEAP